MPNAECIYCSPSQPAKKAYTREHVVPESFGKFRDNLVLNEGVCGDCNKFFGDNLELIFGRGSLEGILRLDYRIKPPEDSSKIRKDRIIFSLSTVGDLNGLLLEYQEENNDLVVLLVPQVAFPRRNGSGRIYVSEFELSDLARPLPEEADTTQDVFIIFNTQDMKDRLIQKLETRNIRSQNISDDISLPIKVGDEIEVAVRGNIDEVVRRCIAKIAFNYLAKTAGIDFVLRNDFDPIRSYIRYGVNPGYRAVTFSNHPILANESLEQRLTNGHLVVVDYPSSGRHIMGQVRLFNFVTYDVVLSRYFSGLWRNITSGHHFDINQMRAVPLQGISRTLPWREI